MIFARSLINLCCIPTTAVWVLAQARSCGLCGGQSGTEVFFEYFGFSWQFSFHRLLHIHHHLLSGACIIGQIAADVPSRLSLSPPQLTSAVQVSVTTIDRRTLFICSHFLIRDMHMHICGCNNYGLSQKVIFWGDAPVMTHASLDWTPYSLLAALLTVHCESCFTNVV
jgi:hypothetical protein